MSKKQPTSVFLFVYGTLKRGFPLHDWMAESKFIKEDKLVGYTLINLGPYPAMLSMPGADNFLVNGEVFEMPYDQFVDLKNMEEGAGYNTLEVRTQSGEKVYAFVMRTLEPGYATWIEEKSGKKTVGRVDIYDPAQDDIPF